MPRRSGVTLVEVLVAIFVMGIGLIALLTLFPIGILRMAQSIRHDRCTTSANDAKAIAIMQGIPWDAKVIAEPAGAPVVTNFFQNPKPGTLANAEDYGPSYPVLVDPIGFNAVGTPTQWVGGLPPTNAGPTGALARRTTSFANANLTNSYRWFSLLDDPVFYNKDPARIGTQPPGIPLNIGTPAVPKYSREMNFTWAYLLRRPQTRDTSVVDCSIVVFEKRPTLTLAESGYGPPYPGTTAQFDVTNSVITVTYTAGQIPPAVRPGNWVYDASILPGANGKIDIPACFYRVVAVDAMSATSVRFETQQPVRPRRSNPALTPYAGTLIVMENIAEVYDVGPMRLP